MNSHNFLRDKFVILSFSSFKQNMSNRRFPTASAFLEMQERRRQYRKHIDALRSCKHMVDDSQPIPPAYLVNRRTRQTKIQKYILRTGEENIRLISRYNESRNKNKKSTSQLKPKSNRPNWVNEMYNSMAISKNSYSSSDHEIKSQKLPPLNSSFENDEIQANEKQEIIEDQNINNTNENNEINDNNIVEEDINDKNDDDNNDQNENENQDQNDTQDIENKDETQDQNDNSNIENENDNQNEEESKNEEENQIENENQDESTNLNENENKDENQEEEELNNNQNESKSENQDEEPKEGQNIDQNETQDNDIEKGDENNQVDTTLGEAGEKGRLDEMLDALNGIVD